MSQKQKIKNNGGEKMVKVSVSTVVYAILIILVFLIGIGSVLAYGTDTTTGKKIAGNISKVIPFPAAIISWNNIVYIDDLENNLASLQKYYLSDSFSKEGLRIDFTTEDGRKRLEIKKKEILDKLIEDKIIEKSVRERGIKVSEKQADQMVAAKLEEFGTSDEIKNDLLKSYGWTLDDFKQQIVIPSLYAQALSEKVAGQQKGDAEAKKKIENAKKALASGDEFPAVVAKYSEGSSKINNGELGWVKKEFVLPELQTALFDKVYEKNNIIESSIGFHIFEITSEKNENGEKLLQLKQIFVAKNTFADWLSSEKKNINVWVPLKSFVWDKNLPGVDFRDEEMREFEQLQRDKVQGDASLMI